jgi:hypothetical protein
MKVAIDLDPRMWWRISTLAEQADTTVSAVTAELLTTALHDPKAVADIATLDERVPEWRRLYNAGVSANSIARRYGVDPHTVINHLRRTGTHIRNKAEARAAAERLAEVLHA